MRGTIAIALCLLLAPAHAETAKDPTEPPEEADKLAKPEVARVSLDDEIAANVRAYNLGSQGTISLPSAWTSDRELQRDLMASFKKVAPRKLDAALKSAGNLHNPRINALRPHFEEALLGTSFATRLNQKLGPLGIKLEGVEIEKFYFERAKGEVCFHAFVWLKVVPVKPPGPSRPSP